jgi:DNA ligase-1
MLAGKAPEDLHALRFPLLASTKLDGIRAIVKDGKVLSRTLKPIRNRLVQHLFGRREYEGFDGELIVGPPNAPNCMQATSSGIMSEAGEPDVKFYLFDMWNRGREPFDAARWHLASRADLPLEIICLPQETIGSVPQLELYEEDVLSSGYEGVILRDPFGPYKFNRSTTREQWMLKLKRFEQDEAVVIGYEELMYNWNDLEEDERGYAKRSTAKDGKVPSGKLGALICKHLQSGAIFNIGTGFTDFQRRVLWGDRERLIDCIVTFKHFAQQGVKDSPRHPVFVSFRPKEDL